MNDSYVIDDRKARRNVAVLVAAQAIIGSQVTMVFVIGGLAGQMLAPNPCLATLPISMVVFGSMSTAPWLSPFMQRHGRVPGFTLGATGGLIGSAVAALAVATGNFWLLLVGSYLTGTYMSAQGFYRFAATDTASDAFRPKAISWVMAGGLLSALVGPQLVKVTENLTAAPFVGTYLAGAAITAAGMFLFLLLDLPKPRPMTRMEAPVARSVGELLRTPAIAVSVIVGAVSYALMNLVMTSTPLAVVGCGYTQGNAADIVSAHVLAMYAPSFVTGHVIARFGAVRVMATGLAILAAAGGVGLAGVELTNFFVALVLLGVGWNFGFIGATTLLTASYPPHERGRVQGMNDMIVFGAVTIASLASGGLMNCSGGNTVQGWSAVNIAMVPFLALAGAALIWLAMRPKGIRG
ncbi:MAG: MFS transporter [Rubellimicrobium sp.]|nr:MFS transporter [Rubellimicrobium sp.]